MIGGLWCVHEEGTETSREQVRMDLSCVFDEDHRLHVKTNARCTSFLWQIAPRSNLLFSISSSLISLKKTLQDMKDSGLVNENNEIRLLREKSVP
jgi:hypothetical protein